MSCGVMATKASFKVCYLESTASNVKIGRMDGVGIVTRLKLNRSVRAQYMPTGT